MRLVLILFYLFSGLAISKSKVSKKEKQTEIKKEIRVSSFKSTGEYKGEYQYMKPSTKDVFVSSTLFEKLNNPNIIYESSYAKRYVKDLPEFEESFGQYCECYHIIQTDEITISFLEGYINGKTFDPIISENIKRADRIEYIISGNYLYLVSIVDWSTTWESIISKFNLKTMKGVWSHKLTHGYLKLVLSKDKKVFIAQNKAPWLIDVDTVYK